MFAGLQRADGRFPMQVRGVANVDEIDVGVGEQVVERWAF